MAHAEKCPICYGTGNKTFSEQPVLDNPGGTNESCRGCAGSGWVEISDEQPSTLLPHGYLGGAYLEHCNCGLCEGYKRRYSSEYYEVLQTTLRV